MEDASKLQSLPSSSRVMRNIAEKQRRDKLNGYINELSTLVPTVAQAPRKLDKTSILRLAASYLRLYQNVPAAVKRKNIATETPKTRFTKPLDLLQSFDSFLVVLSVNQAKILHITENVENLLSYSQVDMLGISFYHFVHLEDHGLFRSQILPHTGFETSRTNDSMSDQRSFCFRIGTKGVSRNEPIIYEKAMLWGHCKLSDAVPSLDNKTNYSDGFRYPGPFRESALPSKTNDMVFVGVVKLLSRKLPSRLTLLETLNDEYMTRHTLDPGARIIMTDHRISTIAGYLADEVTGKSALSFMNPEDLPIVRSALKTLFSSPDGESTIVYRLIRCDGSLIYLRTRGYMEYEPGTKAVKSLICINTLLSEEEGKKALDEARDELCLETGTAVETRISRSSHSIPALTSPDGLPPTSSHVPGQRTRTVSNQDPASPDSGISVNGNDSFVVTDLDSGKPLNLVTCQKFYNDTPSSENLYGAWPKCEETFGLVMRRRGRPSLVYEPYK